jgi:hypothetical protein
MDAESVDALVLCHAFQLIECKNSSHKFQLYIAVSVKT